MLNEEISAASQTSGACGKFGDKLFTVTVVRARQKNAGIAGPTSNFSNAALAAVAKKSVYELSKQPTSEYLLQHLFPAPAPMAIPRHTRSAYCPGSSSGRRRRWHGGRCRH